MHIYFPASYVQHLYIVQVYPYNFDCILIRFLHTEGVEEALPMHGVGWIGIEDAVLFPIQLTELPQSKHEEVSSSGALFEYQPNAGWVMGSPLEDLFAVVVGEDGFTPAHLPSQTSSSQ